MRLSTLLGRTRGSDQDREVTHFTDALGGAIRTGKSLTSRMHSRERSGPDNEALSGYVVERVALGVVINICRVCASGFQPRPSSIPSARRILSTLSVGIGWSSSWVAALFAAGLKCIYRCVVPGRQIIRVFTVEVQVRHKVSLVQTLPEAYIGPIEAVDGVEEVSHLLGFNGIYQDLLNFRAQFAVQPESYGNLYPEHVLADAEREAFLAAE